MTDTDSRDKTQTDGSNDSELQPDGGKNWERIARQRMSVMLQREYDDQVDRTARDTLTAIEHGEDPTDAFWTMLTRFDEFSSAVHQDLATLGDIHYENPKSRLFSTSSYVQEVFLNLGRAFENESVGEGLRGDKFEGARTALRRAHVLLDELEDEYWSRDGGTHGKWTANDHLPTREGHEKQLAGIAERRDKLAEYASRGDQEGADDE